MDLPPELRLECEHLLASPIEAVGFLGGGDINEARRLDTRTGPAFLKMNTDPRADDMFGTEARGLELLAGAGGLRIPRVLGRGTAGKYAFLLLDFIESAPPAADFWARFGQGLATLHRVTQKQYGLAIDNFIGLLPQSNRLEGSWVDFYRDQRLRPQLRMARDAGRLTPDDGTRFDQFLIRLPGLLPEEAPALIHGDLWNGNYLVDEAGLPVLIDPSVSFSHREVDLAMTRLFGGFSPVFYQAYQETYPLLAGWEERLEIYQLYYLLVHVNLFGGSYAGAVRRILDRYS